MNSVRVGERRKGVSLLAIQKSKARTLGGRSLLATYVIPDLSYCCTYDLEGETQDGGKNNWWDGEKKERKKKNTQWVLPTRWVAHGTNKKNA